VDVIQLSHESTALNSMRWASAPIEWIALMKFSTLDAGIVVDC
jgi:hypothetical protein